MGQSQAQYKLTPSNKPGPDPARKHTAARCFHRGEESQFLPRRARVTVSWQNPTAAASAGRRGAAELAGGKLVIKPVPKWLFSCEAG